MAKGEVAIKNGTEFQACLAKVCEISQAETRTAEDFAVLAGLLDDAHKYATRAARKLAAVESL